MARPDTSFKTNSLRGAGSIHALGLMKTPLATLLCVGVVVSTGCASLFHGPDRAPTAQELTGICDWGHRGFAETWELSEDGTFHRTLHEHLGTPSATFTGTWTLKGDQLTLSGAPRGNKAGEVILAEAFFYKHKPAFARREDIENEQVHEWWVCKRRDQGKADNSFKPTPTRSAAWSRA